MTTSKYTTRDDWERRYSGSAGLHGPGTRAHSVNGNRQFYRTKRDALDRCLALAQQTFQGKRILDIGGGSGQFIDYYLNRGASRVVVSDYAESALRHVQQQYANDDRIGTWHWDATSTLTGQEEQFDFVLAMEMIFLISDDDGFARAVGNLADFVLPNGCLLISDVFLEEGDPPSPEGATAKRRKRTLFERIITEHGLKIVGYVPQSVLYNRHVFRRLQGVVERCGNLLYWLDRLAMAFNMHPPADLRVEYLVATRPSG